MATEEIMKEYENLEPEFEEREIRREELKKSEAEIATFKYLEEHYPNPRLESQREEYSRLMRIVQEDIGRIINETNEC